MNPEAPSTILIAEDDATDAFLLRRALAKTNLHYQLRFVADGENVLNYLEGTAPYQDRQTFPFPGLLLLDLRMPVLDGFGVLRRLGNAPRFGHLPVVVFSGSASEEDRMLAGSLGAKAFYVKSGDPRDVVSMFKELGRQWLEVNARP